MIMRCDCTGFLLFCQVPIYGLNYTKIAGSRRLCKFEILSLLFELKLDVVVLGSVNLTEE